MLKDLVIIKTIYRWNQKPKIIQVISKIDLVTLRTLEKKIFSREMLNKKWKLEIKLKFQNL